MEKYENMVEIIKKEYSNAKLVIGEILPRHYHERLKTAEFEQVSIEMWNSFNMIMREQQTFMMESTLIRKGLQFVWKT